MLSYSKLLVFAALLVVLFTASAMAATTVVNQPVTLKLNAGELEITTASFFIFEDVNLTTINWATEKTRTPTQVPTYDLLDRRGNGAGWHVKFTCASLENDDFSPSKILELRYNSTNATLSKLNGQDIDGVGGPLIEAVGPTNLHSATMVINTNEGFGMGDYRFQTPDLSKWDIIIEPSNAFAGLYTSTLTATIISAPGGSGGWSGQVE